MRQRCLFWVFALAAFLMAGGVAQAQSPLCNQVCDCAESCSTACWKFSIPADDFVLIDCGQFGKCITSQSCVGQCGNNQCTHTINGGSGNDTLNGTANHECINGNAGNDTIDGNAGDDRIHGNDGTDTAYGDSGNDCLWGDAGDDHLDGESGNDFADGGAGTDTCTAESKVNCP